MLFLRTQFQGDDQQKVIKLLEIISIIEKGGARDISLEDEMDRLTEEIRDLKGKY